MKKRILNKDFLEELKEIHSLSEKKNCPNHREKLLSMINDHALEITQLINNNDPHARVETGDLIILCMELILEQNGCIDSTLSKCIERFKNKLR